MMDSLIQKYLDGELTEEESRQFLDILASDKEVNREVRALEEVVDLGSQMETPSPSNGFTDRVMKEVLLLERPRGIPAKSSFGSVFRRQNVVPLAASWILALGLGYFLSQGLLGGPGNTLEFGPSGQTTLATATPGAISADGHKVVRLIYLPPETGVSRVRVAGSFNNWDPDKNPMHLEDGRWVTSLILSPDNHEYMFVVDEDTWVTDPLALTTRDDGFGSRNAVLALGI
jgi:anti-sigma factor RsiW